MKCNKILNLIIILLITASAGVVKAANPVVHVTAKPAWISVCKPYDKKPPARNIQNGYFFALIERQIDVERQADYHHNIREIVSEAGIQNGSEISVSFEPAYEKLEFHQITVWRNGKAQNRLNAGDFKVLAEEEDFSKFIYQGSYTANYIIPDIRKGDRIEYAFTITGRNPIFNNKFCENIYLQGYQTIAHQYVTLQASESRKLNIRLFNKVSAPVITQSNGLKHYTWDNYQVQPAPDDNNTPGWYNTFDYVEVSEYNSWAEVVNWALKVNPVAVNIKGELGKRIAKLKAEAGNDKEKYFRAAVKMVQDEVRYMGIEIGEYSHRANHPENVFNQRYGDCKDKALLLASMLYADGIEAEMVLVNTSMQDKIDQLIPTTGAFNHAVVVAYLNGKQVWVDATISYQRGKGVDLYFPNYGKGLQLKAGNNSLINIPLTKTGKITCREKYTVTNAKDKVRLDVKTIYTLNQADGVRSRLASNGLYATEKNYLKYYTGIYSKIESRDSLTVKDDEDKNELITNESYLISNFFKKDSLSDKYTAGFYANCIDEQLPSIDNQTKTPVSLNYPYNADYTIEVVLPGGWNVDDKNYSVKRDAYTFESNYSASGNSLLLNYKFAFLKDFIPANGAEECKKDVSDIKNDHLSYSFSYTPTADANATGKSNIWMMVMAVILVSICTGLAIWIYRIETPSVVFAPGASFTPIGGWLILIMIGLFLTPLGILDTFFKGNYFNLNQWNLYASYSKSGVFKFLLAWETAGNIIVLCTAVFCLILLLNKRDILPRVIICYYAFSVFFTLIEYLLASALNKGAFIDTAAQSLLRAVIIAAIWIPYFKRSTRVEQTFIVPYPHHNFSYETHASTESD